MYFNVSAVKTLAAMKTLLVFPPAPCVQLSLDDPVLQDTFMRTVPEITTPRSDFYAYNSLIFFLFTVCEQVFMIL